MSNGNAGPNLATCDHPSADYINVAASSTSGTYASGKFNVTAPEPVPANLQGMAFSSATFGKLLAVGQVFGPYSFVPAGVVDPTNVIGCKAFPAGAFAGKMALIQRGTCEFGVKVLNAEKAGATFAVIYNSAAGGDGLINMGPGAVGGQVTIPSIFIGLTNGLAMVDWYTANGNAAQAALEHPRLPVRQHAGHHRQLQQPRPRRGQRAEARHRGAGRQHPGAGLRSHRHR